ncbi:MAG TPA: ABC transporter substrate-binding protein [Rhodocyclaceae bacterium]|nr:ABC transporter substrate-binding protein [Rhodocyclaceae bacterium]
MKQLFALLVAICLAPSAAFAQEAPDALVKRVTEEVLNIVKTDKDIQNGNTRRVIDLVEQKVLPNFNFQRMTALALGREWRKATPEQQKQLTNEFMTLLVRTYSNALTAYRDEKIRYKPLKMTAGDTDVVVMTEVLQPGGRPVQLDYSLEKGDSGWKVYDVIVGGISLVTNYRESFAQEVRNGGIDGLIKTIAAKNKSLESGKPEKK